MRYIWLSHVLNETTPLYGNNGKVVIRNEKDISRGDSCNTSLISIPGHSGTHVDTPRHFFETGRSLDRIEAWEWIFNNPLVIDVTVEPGELFPEKLDIVLPKNKDADFLVIRTGFERHRDNPEYWENNPGMKTSFAELIIKAFPKLRGIGLDCISISSIKHRDEGRLAHRRLLGKGLIIIEDMKLAGIDSASFKTMIVSPLRFANGDGAPCSIIGVLG